MKMNIEGNPSVPLDSTPRSGSPDSSVSESEQRPGKLFDPEKDLTPEVIRGVNSKFAELLEKDTFKAAHYLAEMHRAGVSLDKKAGSAQAQEKKQAVIGKLLADRDAYREKGAVTYARYLTYLKVAKIIDDIGEEDKQLLRDQFEVAINTAEQQNDKPEWDLSLLAVDAQYLGAKKTFTEREYAIIGDNVMRRLENKADTPGQAQAILLHQARLKRIGWKTDNLDLEDSEHKLVQDKIMEDQASGRVDSAVRLALVYQRYFAGDTKGLDRNRLRAGVDAMKSQEQWGGYAPYMADLRSLGKSEPAGMDQNTPIIVEVVTKEPTAQERAATPPPLPREYVEAHRVNAPAQETQSAQPQATYHTQVHQAEQPPLTEAPQLDTSTHYTDRTKLAAKPSVVQRFGGWVKGLFSFRQSAQEAPQLMRTEAQPVDELPQIDTAQHYGDMARGFAGQKPIERMPQAPQPTAEEQARSEFLGGLAQEDLKTPEQELLDNLPPSPPPAPSQEEQTREFLASLEAEQSESAAEDDEGDQRPETGRRAA